MMSFIEHPLLYIKKSLIGQPNGNNKVEDLRHLKPISDSEVEVQEVAEKVERTAEDKDRVFAEFITGKKDNKGKFSISERLQFSYILSKNAKGIRDTIALYLTGGLIGAVIARKMTPEQKEDLLRQAEFYARITQVDQTVRTFSRRNSSRKDFEAATEKYETILGTESAHHEEINAIVNARTGKNVSNALLGTFYRAMLGKGSVENVLKTFKADDFIEFVNKALAKGYRPEMTEEELKHLQLIYGGKNIQNNEFGQFFTEQELSPKAQRLPFYMSLVREYNKLNSTEAKTAHLNSIYALENVVDGDAENVIEAQNRQLLELIKNDPDDVVLPNGVTRDVFDEMVALYNTLDVSSQEVETKTQAANKAVKEIEAAEIALATFLEGVEEFTLEEAEKLFKDANVKDPNNKDFVQIKAKLEEVKEKREAAQIILDGAKAALNGRKVELEADIPRLTKSIEQLKAENKKLEQEISSLRKEYLDEHKAIYKAVEMGQEVNVLVSTDDETHKKLVSLGEKQRNLNINKTTIEEEERQLSSAQSELNQLIEGEFLNDPLCEALFNANNAFKLAHQNLSFNRGQLLKIVNIESLSEKLKIATQFLEDKKREKDAADEELHKAQVSRGEIVSGLVAKGFKMNGTEVTGLEYVGFKTKAYKAGLSKQIASRNKATNFFLQQARQIAKSVDEITAEKAAVNFQELGFVDMTDLYEVD